ncbi:cytochrome P450 [Rostrohypoxylon terebratum]|nr:cytochrome P450 [Rostrohypoxylon terebratum]
MQSSISQVNLACVIAMIPTLVLVNYLLGPLGRIIEEFGKAVRGYLRRIQGFQYLIAGPQIIDDAYSKAGGRPFRVPTPSNDHILVTSSELIKEIMEAPLHSLSLHAIATEMLQPKYTMHGFEWQEKRGVEGTGFVRALRSLLTSHLPYFRSDLDRIIRGLLHDEFSQLQEDGYAHVKLYPMMKSIIVKANCFVFFGEDLSRVEEFTSAALEFPQVVILTAECLRITPKFLCPIVASLVTRRHQAAKTLCRYLEPIVSERLRNRSSADSSKPAPVDCMQWLIDTSPRKKQWSPARMIGEILAIWFSSVHQLTMTATYVVQDVCLHEEYVEPLRQEIQNYMVGAQQGSELDVEGLPLLDSFIKESIRCSNVDAITCRRKALRDFTLQDGSVVEKGEWVCIPQRAMMSDPSRYSNPDAFDGFRFAHANALLSEGQPTSRIPDREPSSLTASNMEWPIWGLGNTACPGRFYASLVLKLIVTQIITEWDCIMPDASAPRTMIWRSSVVPLKRTVVKFRKR